MISKRVLRCLALVALVGLSLGVMVPMASADTEITACSNTPLAGPGTYFLTKNLTATGTNCIVIHSSNVAIDMRGHTITGDGSAGNDGITDTGTFVESIAIANGRIKNFEEGIDFSGLDSDLVTLERIEASSNKGDGIFIRGCCNSLTQIRANSNGGAGIDNPECCDVFNQIQANDNGKTGLFENGCCSTATKVTTNNNGGSGILAVEKDGTVLTGCCSSASNITANGNKGDGIFMDNCCNGVVNGKASDNTAAGIDMGSDDNQVANSAASHNGGDGMEFASDTNEVTDCNASNNTVDGIDLGNGDFNTVTHVTTNNNKVDGVVLLCNLNGEGNAVRVSAHNNTVKNLLETGTGICTNLLNNAP